MDPNSTPQTVAQAVQAATQQQQQQHQISHGSPALSTGHSSTVDNLTCQWQGCGERCDSPELLYDHVCERHVGRKSTNNLNLTCQWGACRTTTVKRDHITSHIRVHVPLKPHKCDFCGKAFKRPQDLKKHVKTHADDSVIMNSPQSNGGRNSLGGLGGMGHPNGKPSGYTYGHDTSMTNSYPSYQHAMVDTQNGGGYAHHPTGGQYAGYGSVAYPTSSAAQDIQSMDTRKRAIEALNDFLGDIKRRAIDPHNYYDVGNRLQSNALPLPVGNGYNTGYSSNIGTSSNNYNTAQLLQSFNNDHGGGGGGMHGGLATQSYSLPLPNARTKNDLQDIDKFLEQLQTTVYENSNHAAAAGVAQPGVHSMHTGEYFSNHDTQYNTNNSPHSFNAALNMPGGGPGLHNTANSTPVSDTPELTPGSSYSYSSSGQSPTSDHSRASLSGYSSSQLYPGLPAVTGMSDMGAGYPTMTSAPAPSLASGLEAFDSRRYSGGRLQRQAPGQDVDMADADDGSRTPKASDAKPPIKGTSSIDPALRADDDKSSNGSATTPLDDRRQEEWVENIRVIEALKKYIADRLKNGDYENTDESQMDGTGSKSIEIAKMVEEKMADVDAKVVYPSLPSN